MWPRVAAVYTVFRHRSHAHDILENFLEPYYFNGKLTDPGVEVVSFYADQKAPMGDMTEEVAKQYKVRVCKTIEEALCLGGKELAVDAVLSIGEHGTYPDNEKGQKLYPRRRFFEEICKVFEKTGKSAPVFNDKYLAATWDDAKWMYDRARKLMVPFMAGSSLPVTWRKPNVVLPKDCELVGAVQIGYGPFEGYGFHAI